MDFQSRATQQLVVDQFGEGCLGGAGRIPTPGCLNRNVALIIPSLFVMPSSRVSLRKGMTKDVSMKHVINVIIKRTTTGYKKQ